MRVHFIASLLFGIGVAQAKVVGKNIEYRAGGVTLKGGRRPRQLGER